MHNDEKLHRHETPSDPPCPVCDSRKGCSTRESGQVFCRGTGGATPDGWIDLLHGKEDSQGFHHYRRATPKQRKAKSGPTWSAKAVHYSTKLVGPDRATLAAQLGVPVESLALVPLVGLNGYTSAGIVATFPEVDADGVTVGITERDPSREKKSQSMPGGERGLIVPINWAAPPGPVLAVEGATDVLACAAAGLCVVGRPGAKAKFELLADLLRKLPADRPIIVVGENDAKWNADGTPKLKPDGSHDWPGREGAIATAERIASLIQNPVAWALVPPGAKDSREYLSSAPGDWPSRGAALLHHLQTEAVTVVPVHAPASPTDSPAPLDLSADEDPNPDRWVVPFDAPQRLAARFLASVSPSGSPLRLRHWRDEFHEWRGGCYHTITSGEMEGRMNRFIAAEFVRVQGLYLAIWKLKAAEYGTKYPQAAKVTTALVTSTLASLASLCSAGMAGVEAPAWIGSGDRPPVAEVAAFRNCLLHVTTGKLMDLTPEFFNFSTLAFDYDPAATVPDAWLNFLDQTWPGDQESIDCLQEWFGYLLTPDTRQQKMLWLVGPPRSGKGTTMEVLMNLVGETNVSSPTLQQLSERFGLEPLVNTSVVWFDEPKLCKNDKVPVIVSAIKRITGGSRVDIDRKGIPIIKNVRLGCRFVMSSNEVLELGDASGAMASRMIVISTGVSKIGREDKTLIDRLKAGLPGIFNWALAGIPRLMARGYFVQPRSGMNDAAQLRDLGSPISQFLAECVVYDDTAEVSVDSLFDEYKKWCEGENRLGVGTKIGFARDLQSLLAKKHHSVRKVVDGNRARYYPGIRLRRFYEAPTEIETIRAGETTVGQQGEYQQQGQRLNDAVRVQESTEMAEMIRAEAQMKSTIRADEKHCHLSTCIDYGSSTQMNQELIGNVKEGCSNTVSKGTDMSVERCTLSSGHPGTAPVSDLYFTDEMQLVEYPHNSTADTLQVGTSIHYRATPSTFAALNRLREATGDPAARQAIDTHLGTIAAYIELRYTQEEITAALASPQSLPKVTDVPT